jgi:hypothetical protein
MINKRNDAKAIYSISAMGNRHTKSRVQYYQSAGVESKMTNWIFDDSTAPVVPL